MPLFADVSRLHAEVSRDGEGYVLESTRGVQVNGAAAARAVLKCGDRVTLGATCQFVFRQPVPISPSARLELVSGHRLPLAVDGVLLMADNLILGPGGFNTQPPFHDYDWWTASVTWSPDGTELLYYGRRGDVTTAGGGCCLLLVPVDSSGPARVLDGDSLIGQADEDLVGPWLPLQKWQGLP